VSATTTDSPLLSIRDLSVRFATEGGVARAVSGVSFDVPRGRTVALVGESGSGKSSVALAIPRLVGQGAELSGAVLFREKDLMRLPEREVRALCGREIGVIFQDPLAAWNPAYTIGAQIAEAVRVHEPVSRGEARARATDMLRRAGLPEPEARYGAYPHELSGGMRQRALIAMALVERPALVIADEPTSALDRAVQAQILELLASLRAEMGMGMLVVAHDLALVAEIADEVVVLYGGVVVEAGPPGVLLSEPRHPYTRALLRSLPPAGVYRERGRSRAALPVIGGAPPDPRRPGEGCRFEQRCPEVLERCRGAAPPLFDTGAGKVRCFLHEPGRSSRGGAS
jgi:oligopeptide/dipeptide ABC transporter ATP-binding protein